MEKRRRSSSFGYAYPHRPANEKVIDDKGRVAVERGPIVYCAEWPDNKCNVHTTSQSASSI